MSVDKLVDSAQLDADLTSVANAIRTKGGTSAALAFPAEFVQAIQAIPTGGGGSVTAVTGEITVTADISSPSASASKVFPGIQLDFVPDFMFVAMTYDSYQAIKDSATSHHLYWFAFFNSKDLIPTLRTGSSSNTDADVYADIDQRVLACNTAHTAEASAAGYGITGIGFVPSAQLPHWTFNQDGTFSYGRVSSTQQSGLYAGTYWYAAIKLGGNA